MGTLDWVVLLGFLAYTIWDGVRAGKEGGGLTGYFLAGRSMPWWAVGLSIMATQASAITFISTTGLSFNEDMRFVQVYLAVPLAMAVLSVTLVPFFLKSRAFTAYETLEERFGLPTRLVTAFLFLISRGLALSTVIAAPAYVMALVLGQPLWLMTVLIGLTATVYTVFGGVAGVIRTDVKQMIAIVAGLAACYGVLVWRVGDLLPPGEALALAGALGKLETVSFSTDLSDKYTIWSGVLAGFFLMVSYFGCDQTQVQRYLTSKSEAGATRSLMLNAWAKVPMQFMVMLIGVWMYLFYIVHPAPPTFRTHVPEPAQAVFSNSEGRQTLDSLHAVRRDHALAFIGGHEAAATPLRETDRAWNTERRTLQESGSTAAGINLDDTNYIFPFFIVHEMPAGLAGLIIAAIFAAALSSIDSTLSALSSVTVMDWYRRLEKSPRPEAHYMKASKWWTLFWGLLATGAALALGETSSIVELVNQLGSYFYGSLLGVFVLMFTVRRAGGKAALAALATGMVMVFAADSWYTGPSGPAYFALLGPSDPAHEKALAYLWLNPIGTATVVAAGYFFSFVFPRAKST